ncbi:MAG: hypothetical protein KFE24_04750 [Wolbachia endosymbiont of Homalodisca vitripennis]|nr:hypothetical protein [Wolbachia endosymbiont of Homalodisca vitripennis]
MDQEGGLRVDEDVKPIFDYLKDYGDYIDKRLANPDEIEGITTGYRGAYRWLQRGRVIRACSAYFNWQDLNSTTHEAAKLLNDHEYVCFFSLEMSANQLINRIISIEVNETINNILKNENMDLLYRGINQITFLNILIDNSGNMDLNVLRKKIASICNKYSIKCIYIDYLQLLRGSGKTENRTLEVTEI